MAKIDKADMSCARVKQYTASDVSKAERHNERKNETYENMNERQIVRLTEILSSKVYSDASSRLTIALGKDIAGNPVVADLARMPHLLIAGTTGSGKSVGINATILSLLYKADPSQVRLILIDPKMLELSIYEGIPHLLAPVVTDMRQAGHALNWAVAEMEKRYRLMSHLGVRNLAGYNSRIIEAEKKEEKIADNPNAVSLERFKKDMKGITKSLKKQYVYLTKEEKMRYDECIEILRTLLNKE